MTSLPGSLGRAIGLVARIPTPSLVEFGARSSTAWVQHQVACELAGLVSPPLRVAINQLWLDINNQVAISSEPERIAVRVLDAIDRCLVPYGCCSTSKHWCREDSGSGRLMKVDGEEPSR